MKMRMVVLIVLGSLLITSCGEVLPSDIEPHPPPPSYTESCSDDPEKAELENLEADEYEIKVACLIHNHNDQRRPTMSYHPKLGEVARMRADDMALNGYYSNPPHVDHDGFGPNYYVCLSGYNAPFCPIEHPHDNSIESAAWGQDTAIDVVRWWLNSPPHRAHILGEHEYFAKQTYYGFGHAYAEPGQHSYGVRYWIALLVQPPTEEEGELKITEIVFVSH